MRGLLWPRKDMGLASAYATAVLRDGPVAYWRLGDVASAARTAKDSSGNGLDGTYNASGVTYSARGALQNDSDRAVEKPGAGGPLFAVIHNASLNFGAGSFSVEGWYVHRSYANPRSTATMGKSRPALGVPGWVIGEGYNSNGVNLAYGDGGAGYAAVLVPLVTGQTNAGWLNRWVHLVIVVDRGTQTARAYVDGQRQPESASIASAPGAWDNTETMNVGSAIGWLVDGISDEIAIYPIALTPAQILNHYRLGVGWAAVASPQSWITGALHPAADPITGTPWAPVVGDGPWPSVTGTPWAPVNESGV